MSVATEYTTTRAPDQTAATPRLVPAQSVTTTRPAVPVSVVFLGIVAALVAAWGAMAPFVGPEFGYVADRFASWQWSVTSGCLGLGPGAVAFVASLVVVGMAMRTSYARRADLWVLGLAVTLCGAWFVVGQFVWPVVYGARYIVRSTPTHFMWKELAFAIGPGVILVFCGAVFMGWAVRRQLALVAERYTRTVLAATPTTVVTEPAPPPVPAPIVRPASVEPVTETGATAGATGTMAPPAAEGPVIERVEPPVTAVVEQTDARATVEPSDGAVSRAPTPSP